MTEKPKAVRVGNITVTPITAKEHKILEGKIKKRHERLRSRFREIHGKILDWVRLFIRGQQLVPEYPVHGQDRVFVAVQPQNPH